MYVTYSELAQGRTQRRTFINTAMYPHHGRNIPQKSVSQEVFLNSYDTFSF